MLTVIHYVPSAPCPDCDTMQLEDVLEQYAYNGKIEYERIVSKIYANAVVFIGDDAYGVNDFLTTENPTLNKADAQAMLIFHLSQHVQKGQDLSEVTIKSTKTNPKNNEITNTAPRNYTGWYIALGVLVLVGVGFLSKKYLFRT
jgi:hypothetical protein